MGYRCSDERYRRFSSQPICDKGTYRTCSRPAPGESPKRRFPDRARNAPGLCDGNSDNPGFSMIRKLLARLIEGVPDTLTPEGAKSQSVDDTLLNFYSGQHGKALAIPYKVSQAFEGIVVFGATGSGKSSGPGETIARGFLKAGFGGLVFCAKPEEASDWKRWAIESGRADDVIEFSADGTHRFNFLNYEATRPAGTDTENLSSLLILVGEAISGRGKKDVWEQAMKQFLRNAIDALRLAGRELRMTDLLDLANVSENHPIIDLYAEAHKRSLSQSQREDLEIALNFFTVEWPNLDVRPRSSVQMTLTAMADPLRRGILRDLFAKETTVDPDAALSGKIIVVNLPTSEKKDVGRFAAVIWKLSFQRAALRRGRNGPGTPAFIYGDEAQMFVTSNDVEFMAVARSSRISTVYLSQNLPAYWLAIGGGDSAKAATSALLGNLRTKIWCANADSETNKWAAETVSRTLQNRQSRSSNFSHNTGGGGVSTNEILDFDLQPRTFLGLANGGPSNNNVVEAILFFDGREIVPGTRKVWRRVGFKQRPQ